MSKLRTGFAVVVEGRDDVRAVQEVCDDLIIPTHGYGIAKETWDIIEKAYNEKGIIILTDPDHAGREIRKRLGDKFPQAVHAYLDIEDARAGADIGIENAAPDVIGIALEKALELACRITSGISEDEGKYADAQDLAFLGFSGAEGSSDRRACVCRELGIGYCNASAMVKKLKGFGITKDELRQAAEKIK